jgi:hypothetical protein
MKNKKNMMFLIINNELKLDTIAQLQMIINQQERQIAH